MDPRRALSPETPPNQLLSAPIGACDPRSLRSLGPNADAHMKPSRVND